MADMLSKLVQDDDVATNDAVYFEKIATPAIEHMEVMEISDEVSGWTAPYIAYLKDDKLPQDPLKAKQIKFNATRYFLQDGTLYKKGAHHPQRSNT